MIVKENITINGRDFVKTYSDAGVLIERDDALYREAVDPAEFRREYAETKTPIESEAEHGHI